jgi:hypothetical protein
MDTSWLLMAPAWPGLTLMLNTMAALNGRTTFVLLAQPNITLMQMESA